MLKKPTYEELEEQVRELKQAQKRKDHIKQVSLAIRDINQLVFQETDPKRLIESACAKLTRTLGYHNAWIALIEETGSTIFMTASSGFNGKFKVIKNCLELSEFPDCIRQSLEKDELLVIKDPPSECPNCPLACEYKGRAGLTRRLSCNGSIYGILSVSVPGAFAHDTEEQELFNKVVQDLAFALHKIENIEVLRLANEIISHSPAVAFIWKNAEGWPVKFASENTERIFGWKARDFVSGAIFYADVIHPDDLENLSREVKQSSTDLSTKRVKYTPYRIIRQDGEIRWIENMTFIRRTEDGDIAAYESILLDVTERKRIEDESRFRSFILDQIQDRVTVTDLEGYITYINNAECKMLKMRRDQVIGKHVSIFGEDTGTGASQEEIINSTLQEGEWHGEIVNYDTDGKPVHLYCRSQLLTDSKGEEIALCGISTDITDIKQIEEEIRKNERVMSATLNAMSELVAYLDTDQNVLWTNKAAAESVNETQENLTGKKCYQIWAGRKDRCENCPVTRAIKQGEMQWNKITTPDNRQWEITGYPVKDETGKTIGAVEVTLNITRQQRAEQALRDAELEKRLILDAQPNYVILQALDHSIIWANRSACEWAGRTLEELVGRYCYEVWGYGSDVCPDCPLTTSIETGQVRKITRKTPDGRTWNIVASPVRDEAGQIVKAVKIVEEITERLSLETQLRLAQKMESVGRLAGGVAHDFNNLLSPILAYSEMLKNDLPGDDPRRELTEEIYAAAERATNLTRQLLAFGRKQTMEMEVRDLNKILREFEKLLRRTIRENVEIELQLSSSPLPVRMDVGQVEQVVMNLAVNAQDAMLERGTLTIKTGKADLDETYAWTHQGVVPGMYSMLTISDTGMGMDKETLEHIFEPFFTTKEKDRGTGLGLSTVYGIVKQHSGNIWAYSEPGMGSTFKIYLPLSGEARSSRSTTEKRSEIATGGNETILVVEDEKRVRKLTSRILKSQGYTVLQASHGQKALESAKSHKGPIHLLLTDVVMPGMNGKQVYEQLTLVQPKVKVIYMSGYTDEVINGHQILDKGINFIQKPFGVKQLAAKVRQVLKNRHG